MRLFFSLIFSQNVPANELPLSECLKDTVARVLPYWHDTIAPTIKSGKRVLIAAHWNSLRGLVKYLDDISEEEIVELNIPTGTATRHPLSFIYCDFSEMRRGFDLSFRNSVGV